MCWHADIQGGRVQVGCFASCRGDPGPRCGAGHICAQFLFVCLLLSCLIILFLDRWFFRWASSNFSFLSPFVLPPLCDCPCLSVQAPVVPPEGVRPPPAASPEAAVFTVLHEADRDRVFIATLAPNASVSLPADLPTLVARANFLDTKRFVEGKHGHGRGEGWSGREGARFTRTGEDPSVYLHLELHRARAHGGRAAALGWLGMESGLAAFYALVGSPTKRDSCGGLEPGHRESCRGRKRRR